MKPRNVKMILIAFLCAVWLFPVTSFAETGAVIIAADTSVEVGDTVSVTVKYTATSLGTIDGILLYNPDMLKFVSGSAVSNPSAGTIKMNSTLKGEKSQIYTIRFVAVGTGSNYFVVNTLQLKDADNNDLGKPGASVKYTISDTATPQTPEDPVVAPEDPIDEPSTETPTTIEDPSTDGDEPLTEDTNEKAPYTLWVLAGAIAATTVLIVISLMIVNRKKKSV